MKKSTIAKTVKGLAIGGAVYLLTDLCYQMGKGNMLGCMMRNKISIEDAYELLSCEYETLPKNTRVRLKIMKFFTDLQKD